LRFQEAAAPVSIADGDRRRRGFILDAGKFSPARSTESQPGGVSTGDLRSSQIAILPIAGPLTALGIMLMILVA
jgi:hypothetical protein